VGTQVNYRCGGRQLSAPECPTYITISTLPAETACITVAPFSPKEGSRGWSSGGGGLGVGKTKPLASLGVAFQGLFACLWFGSTVAESTGQHAQHVGLLAQPLFSFWAQVCVFGILVGSNTYWLNLFSPQLCCAWMWSCKLFWLKHILVQAVLGSSTATSSATHRVVGRWRVWAGPWRHMCQSLLVAVAGKPIFR